MIFLIFHFPRRSSTDRKGLRFLVWGVTPHEKTGSDSWDRLVKGLRFLVWGVTPTKHSEIQQLLKAENVPRTFSVADDFDPQQLFDLSTIVWSLNNCWISEIQQLLKAENVPRTFSVVEDFDFQQLFSFVQQLQDFWTIVESSNNFGRKFSLYR